MEGSPAHLSGFAKTGHRVTAVDGRSVFNVSLVRVAQLLEGREKSLVSVEFCDPSLTGQRAYTQVLKEREGDSRD